MYSGRKLSGIPHRTPFVFRSTSGTSIPSLARLVYLAVISAADRVMKTLVTEVVVAKARNGNEAARGGRAAHSLPKCAKPSHPAGNVNKA
jgi:hypothetical protein